MTNYYKQNASQTFYNKFKLKIKLIFNYKLICDILCFQQIVLYVKSLNFRLIKNIIMIV